MIHNVVQVEDFNIDDITFDSIIKKCDRSKTKQCLIWGHCALNLSITTTKMELNCKHFCYMYLTLLPVIMKKEHGILSILWM